MRQLILDTSEKLLESEGLDALSMREVARRAGVTHQAPYHHFSDRAAIVAELITIGFDDLAGRLAQANKEALKTGISNLVDKHRLMMASGMAYIGFAIERPNLFGIMFRPEQCDTSQHMQVKISGSNAYAELGTMVKMVYPASFDDKQLEGLAITYWSQVHGLSCLIIDGPLGIGLKGIKTRKAMASQSLEVFVDAIAGA
jgi:AcrR family transcriptional regulator